MPEAAALGATFALALCGWAWSFARRNVNVVDSLWALFFVAAATAYAGAADATGPRAALLLALVALWAARLSTYLAIRNHGEQEDRRYQAIRARNQPGFGWKSLYLVFGLQALLAWIIAFPLFAAIGSPAPLNAIDAAGIALFGFGLAFEAIADWQLARFKADAANAGRVMDRGLWRYTRHPNYFGEACVWWGIWLVAAAAGAWWTLFAPLLMSFLLLRVSGVALLERDIGERRPAYREYAARTNAFFPGPRRPV